ncbi:MAG: hypothetical protein A3G34_01130 [Candidatus Lindowbacteria bacterium RIFCSPLOWO2_12_FULL_62_27]|nr:MAG: hypothetical protein A3G34_01130 [Candidatus Lindowbacteria bacterium RIFCSPLOWO2_12_FULL_62_27]OGH55791.1 MAG: hypothetical protein A3I06_13285 [Candidatus Lindowbacteria bacterium RIFCSPLOWO2_02_FULL_62_12]
MLARIRLYGEFIKFSHTVFALPFCLIAVLQTARGAGAAWEKAGWILAAFVSARAFAMAMNRILDRTFDAQNPRTASRHLATGALPLRQAQAFAAGCAAAFTLSAWRLNALCLMLSPLVLAYLVFYSYTKRFTRWSHLALGGALALAPLGAEIALSGAVTVPTLALAGSVILWVAGFDIFYACQDVDFDRRTGLHSLPASIGPARALRWAMASHTAAFLLFLVYGRLGGLGPVYFSAQAIILGLLIYEHLLVRRNRIEPAFFHLNGILSLTQLGAVWLDRL